MNKLKAFLFRSEFTKNVAVMMSGNGLSLVIPLLLAPLLTRIYTPTDFAGYELFVRFVALIITVSTLRYELAIILPKSEHVAIQLVRLCFRILIVVTVLSGIILIPFRHEIGSLSQNTTLPELLIWVPLAVFFTGGLAILTQYLIQVGKYKMLATNKVLATTSGNGFKYLLGLKWPAPIGLVFGHILGVAIPVITLLRDVKIRKVLRKAFTKGEVRNIAREYRQFPMYNMPHSLYVELINILLFFVISFYYGEVILGLFAFTFRYLRIPVQVFGSSLSQVFIPRISKQYLEGMDVRKEVIKVMGVLALVGLIPFGLILFYGSSLFGFAFGENWNGSGLYAAIMVPQLYSNFIISPVSMVPTIVNKQGMFFALNVVGTVLALAAILVFSVLDFDFSYGLAGYTGILALLNFYFVIWFLKILKPKSDLKLEHSETGNI